MRAFLAAITLMFLVGPVHADGSLPQTIQVLFARDKPQSLYIVTNYGLMISHDDGCTTQWACEPNVGYGGAYIPDFAVARDGTIFATSYVGLRISRNGGCDFTSHISDDFVAGVAIGPTGEIWATTAASGATNDVFSSTDNGETFTSRGLASSTRWQSIKIAPGDPARAYVAGTTDQGGAALARHDATSWTPSTLTGITFGPTAELTVAAVDPTNPDVVYVISRRANPPVGDRLYRSTDGGMTFVERYVSEEAMRDVVVRDANTVIVTEMQRAGPILVGAPPKISTNAGATFAPLAGAPTLACLTVAPDGRLAGCGANWEPDYAAVTRFDGGVWNKVWRFTELEGPLACDAGTGGHTTCDPAWDNLDFTLQTTGPTCGAFVRDGPPSIIKPPETPPASCCGAGRGPISLVWTFVVGGWLVRRRRRGARG